MKKLGLFFVCGLVSVFILTGAAAAKETVVVYTSLENEEVVEYLKVAKKELSDLDIQAGIKSPLTLRIRMATGRPSIYMQRLWFRTPKFWSRKIFRCPRGGRTF